jgi:hypothetical protein
VIQKDTKDPAYFKLYIEKRDEGIRKSDPAKFIPRCKTADVRKKHHIFDERN